MPLIDYDLHPMALAFGIFCAFVALSYLSAVVYLTFGSTPDKADPQTQEAFVSDEAYPSLDSLADDDASRPSRSTAGRDANVGNDHPKSVA